MSLTFGSRARLRSHQQFQAVQQQGRRVAARYLTVLALPNTLGRDRLGIIASRRLGDAVERNRAKRRIRELFRQCADRDDRSGNGRTLDLVAIARRELTTAPLVDVGSEFSRAIRTLRTTRRA